MALIDCVVEEKTRETGIAGNGVGAGRTVADALLAPKERINEIARLA